MKSLLSLFSLLFLLIGLVPAGHALVIDVTNSAELQAALTMAVNSNEDDTINLATGQYNTTGSAFDGTGLGAFSLTLVGAGPGMTILDGQLANGILELNSGDGNITVQGITFRRGRSGGDPAGGLLASVGNGNLTVQNCEFIDNQTDMSEDGGGANLNAGNGNLLVNQVSFSNNQAGEGGGLFVNTGDGNLTISNSTFSNNQATGNDGGGVDANVGDGNLFITNNTFTNHTAATDGGAIHANAGDGNATLSGNSFTNSTATSGDGGSVRINTGNGNLTFNNNTSSDASANSQGGGLYASTGSGSFTAMNNTFIDGNDSSGDGGAIWFRGSSSSISANIINNIVADSMALTDGGGMFLNFSGTTLNLINNTVTGNTAGISGGGVNLLIGNSMTTFNVYNNIIWNNSATPTDGQDINVENSASGTILLFNNDFTEFCVFGGSCDPADLGANQGDNKIDQDPLFLDPIVFNFHLGPGSPAIDMGDPNAPALPATDHDGNPRIFGAAPDMGALEAFPLIMLDPPTTDFGQINLGNSTSADVTLSNAGSLDVNVTGITLADSGNYTLDLNGGANPCGSASFTLTSGTSCTVTVTFTPNADGTFAATLTVDSNDPNNPSLQATFTGVGIGAGGSLLSGGACALGSSQSSHPWTWGMAAFLVSLIGFRAAKRN